MPTWDSDQYLRFEQERTQPCRDLVARIEIGNPRTIIDLGCGPGNSTAVLAQHWPGAQIVGLDNSEQMIQAAQRRLPAVRWITGEIASWSQGTEDQVDLVFSNASMQWVQDHAAVLPRLMRKLAPGGALAMQMPGNFHSPAHELMRQLASGPMFVDRFIAQVREWHVHDLSFYYDVLAPHARRVDLWETEYLHVMDGAAAIVEWYKGTGLRPFLEALSREEDRDSFAEEYLKAIEHVYTPRRDGKTLFPFRRLFMVAYKRA